MHWDLEARTGVETLRAILESISATPGRYFNVMYLAVPANLVAILVAATLIRCVATGRTASTLHRAATATRYGVAALLWVAALLGSPPIAVRLYSPDGDLSGPTRALLWAVAALLTAAGLLVLGSRRSRRALDGAARRLEPGVRNFLDGGPHRLDVWVGIAASCLVLVNVEAIYFLRNRVFERPARVFEAVDDEGHPFRGFYTRDREFGYRAPRNMTAHVTVRFPDRLVYRVTYTTDAEGHRVTPRPPGPPPAKSVVFFGGSFTFGWGVNDDETLPARLVERVPEIGAANYGYGGYGPQQMLVNLLNPEMADTIEPAPSAAVYVFIDDHIPRAIGSYRLAFARFFPYFDFDENGELVRFGNFTSGRPWRAFMYRLFDASEIIRHYRPRLRHAVNARDLRLTAAIIAESSRRFRDRFGGDLYVLLFPGSRYARPMAEHLEQAGVRTLDYSELYDPDQPGYIIRDDNHPTAMAYRTVAEVLARDLKDVWAPTAAGRR